jgi:hypothetical protein
MSSLMVVRCFNDYISAYFLAEHGGCNQTFDAVTYQASFQVHHVPY